MIERRLFVVIAEAEDGLTMTLTAVEPEFPAEGVIAAFRVPGAVADGGAVLHIPGASAVTPPPLP